MKSIQIDKKNHQLLTAVKLVKDLKTYNETLTVILEKNKLVKNSLSKYHALFPTMEQEGVNKNVRRK